MKVVYLACPYSGSEEQIRSRMEWFCKTVAQLQKSGVYVISPLFMHFVLPHDPSLPNDWEFWKSYSCELLNRSDELYILCLEGWDKSTGIRAEIDIAEKLGKPIVKIPVVERR